MIKASATTQRILIWMTLILIGIYTVGYLLLGFFPPPSPTLDAAQVVAMYSQSNMQARVGVVLCLASGVFLLPFSVVVAYQMARLEEGVPLWAITQLCAGVIGTIFVWGPPIFWGAAAFTLDRDPGITKLAHELGWLTFLTPLCAFPLQLSSIGIVSLRAASTHQHSAFPRWIGYLTLWQAVQSLGGLAAMLFKRGVFAWDGLFPFYIPLTLYGVWTIAVAYTMLSAIRQQENAAGYTTSIPQHQPSV